MKSNRLTTVAAFFALVLPACDPPKPAPARRIDRELEKSKAPDEQVRLLREARQRFGKEEPKKEEPTPQESWRDRPAIIFPGNDPLWLPQENMR